MEPLCCAHCREVIGVYEPIRVLMPDGTTRGGSWLLLEDEATLGRVFHEGCYRAADHQEGGSR